MHDLELMIGDDFSATAFKCYHTFMYMGNVLYRLRIYFQDEELTTSDNTRHQEHQINIHLVTENTRHQVHQINIHVVTENVDSFLDAGITYTTFKI